MTGLIRKATLFSFVGLVVAGTALAGVPNEATSNVPPAIILGGFTGSSPGFGTQGILAQVPDPNAAVVYVIRDANNTPVANTTVTINFAACTDIVFYPQTGLNCSSKTFTGMTDGLGQLTVNLMAHSTGQGVSRATCKCAHVTAGGQPFTDVSAAIVDADGLSGGAAGGDLSIFRDDFLNHPSSCRWDLDGNGVIGGGDLSIFRKIFLGLGSNGTTYPANCP